MQQILKTTARELKHMVTYLTDVVKLDIGLGKVKSKGNLNLAVLEYSVYSF